MSRAEQSWSAGVELVNIYFDHQYHTFSSTTHIIYLNKLAQFSWTAIKFSLNTTLSILSQYSILYNSLFSDKISFANWNSAVVFDWLWEDPVTSKMQIIFAIREKNVSGNWQCSVATERQGLWEAGGKWNQYILWTLWAYIEVSHVETPGYACDLSCVLFKTWENYRNALHLQPHKPNSYPQ